MITLLTSDCGMNCEGEALHNDWKDGKVFPYVL